MMISVWTNPIAIFILIGARTTEQSQVKRELLFCARVLLGNIRRIFLFKNLGYWNAYYRDQATLNSEEIKSVALSIVELCLAGDIS